MGHSAARSNEPREAVSPGALEKGSPGTEAHSSAEGEETGLRPPLSLSVLAAKGKESAES